MSSEFALFLKCVRIYFNKRGDNMPNKKVTHNFCELQNDLELEWINHYLNRSMFNDYNPVISDDVISLSVSNKEVSKIINDTFFQTFDIVLRETKENIGVISFNYYNDEKDKYDVGNVTYVIGKQFQNKGYATRALKLLVNLLKNNNFKGDKDLYFWVNYYNEYSKKVVLNNGGKIISGGEIDIKEKTGTPYVLRIKI